MKGGYTLRRKKGWSALRTEQMPNGYWDRVLRVDLTSGRTWTESLGDEFYRQHIGGRSIIAHYLLKETPVGVDAFSPENPLIFAAGVVTGVPVAGGGRHSVGAKSPLTGAFGEAEAGGFWGAELKHAGYDVIVIEGKAERPSYLSVGEDHVELRDASHLWGKHTDEVEDTVRDELGDSRVRVAQIGIAGENLVKYACIINDLNEAAGRTGLGAVMGSKSLKAIAVRGRKRVPVADSSKVQELARWVATTLDENHRNLHEYGTGAAMMGKHLEGHLIVRNFRDGQMATVDKIDAVAIAKSYRIGMDGCFACPVRCKKRIRLEGRFNVDPRHGGPEYETLGAIGSNLALEDLAAICKANEMLNYYGLDTISFGATIAWAIECYELGLLTESDTNGVELRWNDGDLLIDLVEAVARRKGFGDLLAEGALGAARRVGRGTEQYAMQVKGLELGMHDPRAMEHLRTNYAVSPTGGDHTGAAFTSGALRNTAGVCLLLRYNDDQILDLVNGVTGWNLTSDELQTIARRGLTMARLFNLREGFGRADDRQPWRIHQPLSMGPMSDFVLPVDEIDRLVREYYIEQGWDPDTGVPTERTLSDLGLTGYASSK